MFQSLAAPTPLIALLGLATFSLPAFTADGLSQQSALAHWTLSSEMEYSSGKYGNVEATDILYLPLVAKYESGSAIFKLTVPYVEISGPADVQIVSAGQPGPVSDSPPSTPLAKRGTVSGLGDIVASGSTPIFYKVSSGLMLDIGGKIKFATASKAKGLGSGEHDFGVQADAYQSLGKATTLMATLGYTWMGKPESRNFRNIAFASVGIARKIDPDITLSGFLDIRQSVVSGSPAPRELSFYLSRRLSKNWKIQAYALVGISDASPQKGIGATLGYSM
jgi:hypothetical protein